MVSIEIDDDIFNYLKLMAEPFVDTPNTVLRRLLFPGDLPEHKESTKDSTASKYGASSGRISLRGAIAGNRRNHLKFQKYKLPAKDYGRGGTIVYVEDDDTRVLKAMSLLE